MILNIIVLATEILFYSLFMKFVRKEGKLLRYILLFIINTIFVAILGFNNIATYLIFVFITYILLKYLVKTKVQFYDMFLIVSMMIFKILIETPLSLTINIFIPNIYIVSTIVGILKNAILILLRNKLSTLFSKIYALWRNNNFYIRYIFCIIMFVYVILSCVFIIKML